MRVITEGMPESGIASKPLLPNNSSILSLFFPFVIIMSLSNFQINLNALKTNMEIHKRLSA